MNCYTKHWYPKILSWVQNSKCNYFKLCIAGSENHSGLDEGNSGLRPLCQFDYVIVSKSYFCDRNVGKLFPKFCIIKILKFNTKNRSILYIVLKYSIVYCLVIPSSVSLLIPCWGWNTTWFQDALHHILRFCIFPIFWILCVFFFFLFFWQFFRLLKLYIIFIQQIIYL